MKKSTMNSKNTVSENEKGLKHLRLVGIGREYIEGRSGEMQDCVERKVLTSESSSRKTNGGKEKK